MIPAEQAMIKGPNSKDWQTRAVHPGKIIRNAWKTYTSPDIPDSWVGYRCAIWKSDDGVMFAAGIDRRPTPCRIVEPIIKLQLVDFEKMNLESVKYIKKLEQRIEKLEKKDHVDATAKAFEYFRDVHRQTERTKEVSLSLQESRLLHGAVGLASEAGEVLDVVKKQIFGYHYDGMKRGDLLKELSDVAWYFYLVLDSAGITMEEVFIANADKLSERYKVSAQRPLESVSKAEECQV